MNIITEQSYDKSRWSIDDKWWDMELSINQIVAEHNKVVIKLQGDHDTEMDKMRHLNANLQRDLNYVRAGKANFEERMKNMSRTITKIQQKIKDYENQRP
jgi:predicted  nucleic acid-binding Zn-ribbon protein